MIVTILIGSTNVWQSDILIPKQHGIDTNIGDTRGPSGIFRAARTVPVMLDIARDMERLCPNAVMLNYTNPMVMNCRAVLSQTSVVATGLCRSVQGTAEMLASWIGAPMQEITYTCAGINQLIGNLIPRGVAWVARGRGVNKSTAERLISPLKRALTYLDAPG